MNPEPLEHVLKKRETFKHMWALLQTPSLQLERQRGHPNDDENEKDGQCLLRWSLRHLHPLRIHHLRNDTHHTPKLTPPLHDPLTSRLRD